MERLFIYYKLATEFGWKPDEVDKMDATFIEKMIAIIAAKAEVENKRNG